MPDETPSDAAWSEATDVRFSIRSILIVMVPVALLAAAMGPYLRGLSSADRLQVGVLWGVCLTFLAAWLGHLARRRYRLERAAGGTLLEFAARVRQRVWTRAWSWPEYSGGYLMIGFGVLYLFIAAAMLREQRSVGGLLYMHLFFGILCSRIISQGIATIWWNRTVQLREHGVLYGVRLLRWTSLTDCRWLGLEPAQGGDLLLEGVDQKHIDVRWYMTVPAKYREATMEILTEKVAAHFDPALAQRSATALQSGRSFPMISYRETAARGCLMGAVIWVIGILVAAQAFRFQSQEFAYGFYGGLFAAVAVGVYRAQQTGKAGAPRLRLNAWFNWPALLSQIAIAAICYFVVSLLPSSLWWLAGALGIVCGVAIFSAVGASAAMKIDLCENGVVIPRWRFRPWESINAFLWAGGNANRLVLGHGWRRLIAVVPPEQREAVEAVLKEKLEGDLEFDTLDR